MWPYMPPNRPMLPLPPRSIATSVEPKAGLYSNRNQPPFHYWRNYDIAGLDRNTAPAFFNELDRRLHVVLTPSSLFNPNPTPQTIELRMDIVPYNHFEADLFEYDTAFFLRCGKVTQWKVKECKILHETIGRTLPRGCTWSLAMNEIARAY